MLPLSTILFRLLWGGMLGAAIGVERSYRRRPAGMRTGFCVCLASALFTVCSVEIARRTGDASTTRIASNIVQGIGFLGAGVILRERGSVVGLTTASTIFAMAAIGMTAGGGLYAASGAACGLTIGALIAFYYLENWLNLKPRYMLFRITSDLSVDMVADVHRIFCDFDIALDNFQVSMAGSGALGGVPGTAATVASSAAAGKNVIQFDAEVSHRQQEKVLLALSRPGVTCEMYPVERQNG
jgi:putative Mg2+ transporter-C (MgtC) family protein